ncbi:hypothetical protein ES703_87380 [subsurface metagenome]
MKTRPRTLVFLASILLGILVMLVSYSLLTQEIIPDDLLVAIVNGVEVVYGDIKADRKIIQLTCTQGLSKRQFNNEVRKHEMRRLSGKIHEVIFTHAIDEMGLTVSEEEIDFQVDELFRKGNLTDEQVAFVCTEARALHEALEAWHRNPGNEDAIYNEKLASLNVTRDQWKLHQACWDTPEKLKRFVVPSDIEDMKRNSRGSSRRDVFYKKLGDIITSDISVTDDEVKQAYQNKYSHLSEKLPLYKVEYELRSELLAEKKQEARKLWNQEQYRKANIEIKDTRFDDVLNILRGLPLSP